MSPDASAAIGMIELPAFKWVDGMQWVDLLGTGTRGRLTADAMEPIINCLVFPDLTDAATRGCIEHRLLGDGVWIQRSSAKQYRAMYRDTAIGTWTPFFSGALFDAMSHT